MAIKSVKHNDFLSPFADPEELRYAVPVTSKSARSLEGKRLGPYTLDTLIGGGATGDVYRGHDKSNKRVAVKILATMEARSAAKVLQEFKDKSLAAEVCEMLKRIQEEQ